MIMRKKVDKPTGNILVVDDHAQARESMTDILRHAGHCVRSCASAREALGVLDEQTFDVILTDLQMPGMNGLEFIRQLEQRRIEAQVAMVTAFASVTTAVDAMRHGAFDYIEKPFDVEQLESLVDRALRQGETGEKRATMPAASGTIMPAMIGDSPAMRRLRQLLNQVGPTSETILITGESGTGKELVARAIHEASPLVDKPLVVINCAALPESLLESELFGHEKGTFTGAVSAKAGLFEIADGGTLFIDEIGELAGSLQAKLLRVLEDGSMRRIGSVKERRVKVRIISATNRDLAAEVKAMRFREDLYYRINVMTIEMPPLRIRQGDVPLLVRHLIGPDWQVEDAALRCLENYTWPGNVRQLSNALERAKIMADDQIIRAVHLPAEVRQAGGALANSASVARAVPAPARSALDALTGDNLTDIKRSHIVSVLEREQGNKARAARALGVSRRKLYRLLEKYQILD